MNKYDRTAQQGTEAMREGRSEGASLALQPYPHLPRDSWRHSRSWGSARKSSPGSSSDPGLQTEAKIPHKLQCSGASSAEKTKRNKTIIFWVISSASQLGMTFLDAEPRLEDFTSSGHLTQRSCWAPRDVADMLSTHWPGASPGEGTTLDLERHLSFFLSHAHTGFCKMDVL